MNSKIAIAMSLLVLATSAPAQKTESKSTAWPKISKRERQRVKFQLRQLAAKDAAGEDADFATVEAAEAALVEMGAGITLELLRQLTEQDQAKTDAIERVLDAVLTPEHAPLIARLVRRKEPEVRRYAVARLARFHLPEMAPVYQEALQDREPEVVFVAALGLGGLGQFDHMQIVFDRCRKGWPQHGKLVSEVLEPARGEAAADWVFARIQTDDTSGWVAGLRLLRSLAPKSYQDQLKPALDAEQNSVKRAAINALRMVVDGDPPLDQLSVFEAIELAQQWRER